MTSFTDAANTIRSRWASRVATAAFLPTQYDNAPAVQRTGAHAVLSLLWGGSLQVSTSGGALGTRQRNTGVLSVLIRIPVGVGDNSGSAYIDAINSAFCNTSVYGIVFKAGTPRVLGQRGAFWEIAFTVPFNFDQMVLPPVDTEEPRFTHFVEVNATFYQPTAADIAALATSTVNAKPILLVYVDESLYNSTTEEFNTAAIIAYIASQGATVGGAEFYVAIDHEVWDFDLTYPVIGATTAEGTIVLGKMTALVQAIKAHFGANVKVGWWSLPSCTYWEYYYGDAGTRQSMEDTSVARFQAFCNECDFMMPQVYELWVDSLNKNPATRLRAVTTSGNQAVAMGTDYAQFEAAWVKANDVHVGSMRVCRRIQQASGKEMEIIPSWWMAYNLSQSLCFYGSDFFQYIPANLWMRKMNTLTVMPGFTGVHVWSAAAYHAASIFNGGTSLFPARQSIIDTLYGGVNPVPGTYPNWGDALFKADWGRRHNAYILDLLRQLNLEAS